ncbi:MAG: Alkaline phosphatase synthesis sensor protein PhoR [Smithella sp. PtaU1.Bin162]|nr:MAG: Alkaline phosphatase synthesis sensor protein PhoR [Smithella sp. PtaU1.Bin162]
MKKSFRRKIIIGFLAMVFLSVFTACLAFFTTRNMQNVFLNTMRQNVASLKAAEELELALVSQKGFLSNYFLDKNSVWLERLEEKRANFSEWLKKATDTAVTPEEKNIINDINHLYARYENDRLNAKKLYESGKTREAKDLLLGDMWEALEILYQKCENYISINESIIKKSEGALTRKIAGMMVLIVIPSIAIIISIGLMFFLLTRKILSSVEDIAVTARNINLKDLSGRVNTDSLEEELDYLAKSINAMLDRLERSFEYVKEFSSSIGHELKTPLAIIKGGSEIALRKERQADEYKKALRVNIEESNRMIQIVEDLVFLAKLDYNPDNIKKERFDAVQFFEDIRERAEMLAAQKGIIFSSSIPENPVFLEGNKLHLSRLFFNLIQNAVKFTPQGGKVDLSVHPQGDAVKIIVSDTGAGIDEKDLPKIFQRFFHKETPGPENVGSVGLGLNIARSIAKFHNGDIQVASKPQEGSVFTVTLPVSRL